MLVQLTDRSQEFLLMQDDVGKTYFDFSDATRRPASEQFQLWFGNMVYTLPIQTIQTLNVQRDEGDGTFAISVISDQFLHAFYTSQWVTVVPPNARPWEPGQGTQYPLTGIAAVITVMHRCADAIVADKSSHALPPQVATNPPLRAANAPSPTEISFERDRGGMIIVPVTLNGAPPVKFMLDSGASGVQIPTACCHR
jgi:hypothetical protein